MKTMFLVLGISMLVALLWDNIPVIKDTIHSLLNPTIGSLLNWNVSLGLLIVTAIIVLITTVIQKQFTDQVALKGIKEEQKKLQEQMKEQKSNPQKLMELQKKSMELAFEMMPLSMRPLMYTAVPFILFLRWFGDYFTANPAEILGFLSWFWAYIIFSIFFSLIFRKLLKVH